MSGGIPNMGLGTSRNLATPATDTDLARFSSFDFHLVCGSRSELSSHPAIRCGVSRTLSLLRHPWLPLPHHLRRPRQYVSRFSEARSNPSDFLTRTESLRNQVMIHQDPVLLAWIVQILTHQRPPSPLKRRRSLSLRTLSLTM